MSKRTKIIAAVTALLIVIGVVAAISMGAQGSGPEIETARVQQKDLAVTVTAAGKIGAGVSADVYPPTAGTIDDIFVSDGETVTAGAKLADMDTGPLELQLAQAQAALSQAKAQLAGIDAQAAGPADVAAARANVEAARRAYEAAVAQERAVGTQAPTSAQRAAARAATAAARTAYENAVAAYEAARLLPSNEATIAIALAARDQAYAAYLGARSTEDQLNRTSLTAARAQARAGVAQAFAAWKAAQAQLAKLCRTDTSAQREAARAAVRQAAEAVQSAEKNLDRATMVAPIDGIVVFNSNAAAAAVAAGGGGGGTVVSDKPAEGAAVSPQAPPFSVVDMDALRFTAEVDEADVERVDVGMKATVTLDSFPGDEFTTTVVRVNPVAQPTATGGTVFAVDMVIEDTAQDILIGMKGDATIEVSSRGQALTVPVEALFSEGGTDYVYVVSGNRLKKTEITAGASTDTEIEVLSGLDEGDTVALSGSTQYTDGMQVRVKKE